MKNENSLKFLEIIKEFEMEEAPSDFRFFQENESLELLRDALAKNKMVSVAYVKKDGSVRHMLIRRSLASHSFSENPKSDAQMNVQANNDIKRVIDMSAYRKHLKEFRNQGIDDSEAKSEAAKKAWRTINLKEVLGFLVGGNFVDLRDENDILQKYGQEVYDSLTKGMINSMQVDQDAGEEQHNEQTENIIMDKNLNEQVNRIKEVMGMINEHNFIPDVKKFTDYSRFGSLEKDMRPIIPPDEMEYGYSSVESDDYDEKQERNYGVEDMDRGSEDEELWGPEEDERADYEDRKENGEY